jgi:hypothetical protein
VVRLKIWFLALLTALLGCNATSETPAQLAADVNAKDRAAAAKAAAWALGVLDKAPLVGQPAADEVAKLLQKGSTAAVAYLASPAARTTADNVNTYLKDLLYVSIPAPVIAIVDVAAGILDKVGIDPTAMVTQQELDTLTAFAAGIGDGVAQWRAGKIPAAAPAAPNTVRAMRFWLHADATPPKK